MLKIERLLQDRFYQEPEVELAGNCSSRDPELTSTMKAQVDLPLDNDDDDDDDDEDDEKDPDLTATMRAQVAQPEEVATVFIATVIH